MSHVDLTLYQLARVGSPIGDLLLLVAVGANPYYPRNRSYHENRSMKSLLPLLAVATAQLLVYVTVTTTVHVPDLLAPSHTEAQPASLPTVLLVPEFSPQMDAWKVPDPVVSAETTLPHLHPHHVIPLPELNAAPASTPGTAPHTFAPQIHIPPFQAPQPFHVHTAPPLLAQHLAPLAAEPSGPDPIVHEVTITRNAETGETVETVETAETAETAPTTPYVSEVANWDDVGPVDPMAESQPISQALSQPHSQAQSQALAAPLSPASHHSGPHSRGSGPAGPANSTLAPVPVAPTGETPNAYNFYRARAPVRPSNHTIANELVRVRSWATVVLLFPVVVLLAL